VTMVAQVARSLPSGPAGVHRAEGLGLLHACCGNAYEVCQLDAEQAASCQTAVYVLSYALLAINPTHSPRNQLCLPAVYDFEYELESTRGRKRILSTGQWGFCASWHREEER